MPSRRQERVNKRIVQEVVTALRRIKRDDIGFVTLTRCEVSHDMRHATVFLSIYGSSQQQEHGLEVIRHNASRIRFMIGRPLGLKNTPQLHFEFDSTVATGDRMLQIIREARQTDRDPSPLTPVEVEELVAGSVARPAGEARPLVTVRPSDDALFEQARQEMQAEADSTALDDTPGWQPIDLDAIPDAD
ncbi:MAG: 30S ribosome-binding factor RbfA [Planctomycetota bacterium]|jgi:ribosome-binding factor A|nr:30S ribosome-binding factor RbfA [Planctomycetota bacterium]